MLVGCKFHPATGAYSAEQTPKATQRTLGFSSAPPSPQDSSAIPPELTDSMSRSVAYVLDFKFILDTLYYSRDETLLAKTEEALNMQPTSFPLKKDLFAVTACNDD